MSHKFDIHPDLGAIKGRRLPLNPWVLAFIGRLFAIANALHSRKFKGSLRTEKIASSGGARVPVHIFKPERMSSVVPALLYYHGGGFVLKQSPGHLDYAFRYAQEANCCVVLVDYRLAPKHPFPAAFDDSYAALRWTIVNAEKLGVDPTRIAVGGDSAGGALAAGVAQKAVRDGIVLAGQLLLYPLTDAHCQRPSVTAYASAPPFKDASSREMWETYLGHPLTEPVPPYASPIQGDLNGLARAYVEVTQFDPLHDQGLAYADALTAAGVRVAVNEIQGGVHAFDLFAANSGICKRAVQARIEFLRQIFAVGLDKPARQPHVPHAADLR